ncbi:calcium-binding protein [Oceanibacterium hippocampi]|uniref:Serralysin B n=1 Tax=Oceanibacterium hippocampi TaxID=745714 RepID=A0A1Y5TQK1_9PROT|nr:hypothetical protein [Oceanibacterium hippocampi]SLN69209.1 Serralysin B precursor [Oceanibacterium hippocampi]
MLMTCNSPRTRRRLLSVALAVLALNLAPTAAGLAATAGKAPGLPPASSLTGDIVRASDGRLVIAGQSGDTVRAPALPQPSAPDEIVAVRFLNHQATPQAARTISFGQAFVPGDLAKGFHLEAHAGSDALPTQVDVKARHDDGSVRHAIVTVALPLIAGGTGLDVMLHRRVGAAAKGHVALSALAAAGYGKSVEIVPIKALEPSPAAASFDVAEALAAAEKAGGLETWLDGPLVTEYVANRPVDERFSVGLHVRVFADGPVRTALVFHNDAATVPNRNLQYGLVVRDRGAAPYRIADVFQHRNATWRHVVWQGVAPAVQIVPDVRYLMRSGALPSYDLSWGVSDWEMQKIEAFLDDYKWEPMGSGSVHRKMPAPGGRADLGLLPRWSAEWVVSMDPRAEALAKLNAEVAGTIPWHFRDPKTDRPLRIDNRPRLYLGGAQIANSDLPPGGIQREGTGWTPDAAHVPSLTYLPYLLTGDRYYLEELMAQAAWHVAALDPNYRQNDKGLIEQANQVRGQAWTMRTLSNAAFVTPDDDPMKGYFVGLLERNLDAYLGRYVERRELREAGDLEGYIWRRRYVDPGAVAPWEDDFFTSAIGLIASRGSDKAVRLLRWKANWTVGRFLSEDKGFNPFAATAYRLFVVDRETDRRHTKWSEVVPDDGWYAKKFGDPRYASSFVGYANATDGYVAHARAALAAMVTFGIPGAIDAFRFVVENSETLQSGYDGDPTFLLAPSAGPGGGLLEQPGFRFADEDGERLEGDGAANLLAGGNGDDVLAGGGGSDLMAGGAGADRFVVDPAAPGRTVITDFEPGRDRLVVPATLSPVLLLSTARERPGSGLEIALSDGATIVLSGISRGKLSAADFEVAR